MATTLCRSGSSGFKHILFDIELGLIEINGTVGLLDLGGGMHSAGYHHTLQIHYL